MNANQRTPDLTVVFEGGYVWDFDELPANTIALDGAVLGPHVDAAKRRFSFDHHGDCVRLVTAATCQQVLDAILLGLDPTGMRVLVNDVDADTVLACWLLRHAPRWRDEAALERVRPLVDTIGSADAHGPAYPLRRADLSTHFHTVVLSGVRAARASEAPFDGERLLAEAEEVLERWWAAGLTPRPTLAEPLCPPVVREYDTWVLAVHDDVATGRRTAGVGWLYERGHDRVVLATGARDGRFRHTIAKRSDLVAGFPLPALFDALNVAEQIARAVPGLAPDSRWGGSSSIGGGPRAGSVLAPPEVARVVVDVLAVARERVEHLRTARPTGPHAAARHEEER